MKRKLAFLLIVATMLFTLAGCGGGTAANESAATENSAASESESAASAEATTNFCRRADRAAGFARASYDRGQPSR